MQSAYKTRYAELYRIVTKILSKTKETFDNVIFTDECTVAMESNLKLSFRRWWEPPKLKGKPKHPYKVHVWAGISKWGATTLAVFGGIMESTFFTEDLLSKSLMPFIRETFPDGHRFQQDNDPKNTSKLTQKFIDDNNINKLLVEDSSGKP